jgi:hypothetical protein
MADPRPLLDSYSLYIDGRWVDPGSGRYDDINPATEATIAQAPDAGLADVDAAIAAARRAFDSGPWAVAARGAIAMHHPAGQGAHAARRGVLRAVPG